MTDHVYPDEPSESPQTLTLRIELTSDDAVSIVNSLMEQLIRQGRQGTVTIEVPPVQLRKTEMDNTWERCVAVFRSLGTR